MLFGSYSTALYAIDKSLKAEPGSEWGYSSGTSNIIAHLFKIIIADQGKYFTFPHTELFKPLGLEHVVFEPDAEGTYIGSSFMHATARDWARIGQLYLQNGVWNGKRLLPEGWVKYSIHPAPNAPENLYGSHIWLKPSPAHAKKEADFSQIPDDAYFFLGYEGQIVTIIPSLELVTVRLGLTRYSHAWHHPTFMGKVIAAITD
jgi:CubicO group peptidase (beta-lactamase class C family)